MPARSARSPVDSGVEMYSIKHSNEPFFNMKELAPRPVSNVTEMFDTDFEDDESEVEDNSPRLSMNSTGQRSESTISSFEEVHTPSPYEVQTFNFDLPMQKKSVEGPVGPHLFRTSIQSTMSGTVPYEDGVYLGMSPVTPRAPRPRTQQYAEPAAAAPIPITVPATAPAHRSSRHRPLASLSDAMNELSLDDLVDWTAEQVGQWMAESGFETSIVEKFLENDINGAILITLKFEDLRELDIPSFGQRTKVWNEIHVLRGSARNTPKPSTPIEESVTPVSEYRHRHVSRRPSRKEHSPDCASDEEHSPRPHRKSSKRRHRKYTDDVISPLESVSIVGIEQLMPKAHNCSRGENCSKYRRQQRLIEAFKRDHPSDECTGSFYVVGDPGNASTAEAVRPFSDVVPSVVASSDVLGPGPMPTFQHLEESSLKGIQSRDPQDNVKQFIRFQHLDPKQSNWSSEEPPTPPYEMFPTLPTPVNGLRNLPRLSIPPPPRPIRSASAQPFSPYRMDRAEALTPELRTATQSPNTALYRLGSPFSEMDVPVTAVPLGPVARDVSQSVPPNMAYKHSGPPPTRTASRSSRRPSFAMPRVDEQPQARLPRPFVDLHRVLPASASADPSITHAGPMKKRKTRLLRHEWHTHHFTLSGTTLRMHRDASALDVLEHIDVDDYAIACSSVAGGSKIAAAFKAMNIARAGDDTGAFGFQLIPVAIEKGTRLRKRESLGLGAGEKGKTHYFAVRSRDERIDWMRELMLAKALKQKTEGFEINVNGNMI